MTERSLTPTAPIDELAERWRNEARTASTLSLWLKSIGTFIPWAFYVAFKAMIEETEIWHDELDRRHGWEA